jgi:hypothetical protein
LPLGWFVQWLAFCANRATGPPVSYHQATYRPPLLAQQLMMALQQQQQLMLPNIFQLP